MTTTTAPTSVQSPRHLPAPPWISTRGKVWIGILSALFVILYWSYLYRMGRIATGDNNWSHALIVPFISIFYLYQHRQRLAATPQRVFWPGLLILFLGMFSYAWWIYPGRNDMFQGYSVILSLFGLTLFLLGWRMMRIIWFPIAFLAFAVKVAPRIWDLIAWKLQGIASRSAAIVLKLLTIDAEVEGTTIHLYKGLTPLGKLNVAEACSGLRMLMAFLALGTAMAFLIQRSWWQRLIMILMAVPIAVAVNVGRVTVIGLLYLVNPEMASGDFHTFVGMLMLIPAAGLFWLLGWVLDQLIIHDDASEAPATDSAAASAPAAPPQSAPAAPEPPVDFAPIFRGLLIGAVVTVLVGINYGLLLGSFQPQLLGVNPGLIAAGQVIGLALLGVAAWWIWQATASGQAVGNPRTITVSMALCAGVLFAAVLGFNGVVHATKAVLIKGPVELREPLYQVPKAVGPWELVQEDPPMTAEMLETLGTNKYISRVYRDTQGLGQPGDMIRLHVAYYTGTIDTVPHVPERCYVAGGMIPVDKTYPTLRIGDSRWRADRGGYWASSKLRPQGVFIPRLDIPATIFTFSPGGDRGGGSNVIYFFIANGKFLPTPDHVRALGFDPRDRYAYYCKVEVSLIQVSDQKAAQERSQAFLTAALPEIMACLPDWNEVKAGLWPPRGGR